LGNYDNPNYCLFPYGDIPEKKSIKWDMKTIEEADASKLDERLVMALIIGTIRTERLCDGVLLFFFKSEAILQWLEHLRMIVSKER